MRNDLSILTNKNSLLYFLTSVHFYKAYQVPYILCIRNNIFSKNKSYRIQIEKSFSTRILQMWQKMPTSVDMGMA